MSGLMGGLAIIYGIIATAKLFSQGDTSGGIGALLIGGGGVALFVGKGLAGILFIGVGIAMTFLGPKAQV